MPTWHGIKRNCLMRSWLKRIVWPIIREELLRILDELLERIHSGEDPQSAIERMKARLR